MREALRPMPRNCRLLVLVSLLLATTPACFVRRRTVSAPAPRENRPLLTATKEELLQRLHRTSDSLQSFLMRVELSPSVLDPTRGVATDYATVGAYILFQRPDNIRILGQDPVVSSTIFDMVSGNNKFRVSIPSKKLFLVGSNDAPPRTDNKLENLRPTAFLTSLLIDPPQAPTDYALLDNDTERSVYIVLVIRRNLDERKSQDEFLLVRSIFFDRHTLEITQQKTFDQTGTLVGDTRYSQWQTYDGVPFPSQMDIQRPKENYEVQLSVLSMKINSPDVSPAKFVLEQPPGTQLRELK